MLKLYFTDHKLLALPIVDETGDIHHTVQLVDLDTGGTRPELKELVGHLNISPRQPFFLEDGCYWEGSDWFSYSELKNPNTLEAYGRDLDRWFRFLDEAHRGRKPFEAKNADLNAYKRLRRTDLNSDLRVSARTWNRELAPIKLFYDWAEENGHIGSFPFKTKKVRGWRGMEVIVLTAADSWQEDEIVRSVSTEDYKLFRNVGLRGVEPDGTAPAAGERIDRGMAERDCAIADLLIYCGLRATEALTLFKVELPVVYPSTERHPMLIVGKGGKSRTVNVPTVLLERLHKYSDIWRQLVVERCQDGEGLWAKEPPDKAAVRRIVTAKGAHYRAPGQTGQTKRTSLIEMEQRRDVFISHEDGRLEEPAVLFLGAPQAGGHGLTYDGFKERWEGAKERVRRHGKNLDFFTPHMLRHTFAINYLSHLIHEVERAAQEKGRRKRLFSPIGLVATEMGHSSITTTQKYLTHIHQAQDIQDRAYRDYAAALEGGGG